MRFNAQTDCETSRTGSPVAARHSAVLARLQALRSGAHLEAQAGDGADVELAGLARTLLQREEELERLFDLVDTVQRGRLPEEVLQRIYDSFAGLIPYERIGCAFLSDDGATLTAHWARSELGPVRLKQGFASPMEGSSLQVILETGEPRILNDLEAYLDEKPGSISTRRIVEEGGRSSLTCPLAAEGRPIGFLFFTSRHVGAYRDVHPAIFRQIAGQVSLVIERSRIFERVHHAAFFDALTDLPNRTLFFQTLQRRLDALAPGESLAVHYLDLDHFKHVNDTLGHPIGDRLLKTVARRLSHKVGEKGLVARLGGDEFAIVQGPLGARSEASQLAASVIDALRAPMRLSGHDVEVGVSVGVAVSEAPMAGADDLVKRADIALYEAKTRGRGVHCVFEARMDEHFREQIDIERALRRALANGEIDVHYQPIIAFDGVRVVACEALARWRHPERGMIAPIDFIPVAERAGLIGELGAQVLRKACLEAAGWPGDVRVAVNVSARQLHGGFAEIVRAALATSGLAPDRLELELTESVFLEASCGEMDTLKALKEMGVSVALDDFGTGFSSLAYLRRFRFSRVKIDRSFIANLPDCPDSNAILHAVSQLAAALDIRVTAEGVETQDQLRRVWELGCSEMQGYLVSPPRRPEDLRAMLGDDAP
jgi:diguanylate cyclase (GGDEF)-like protein